MPVACGSESIRGGGIFELNAQTNNTARHTRSGRYGLKRLNEAMLLLIGNDALLRPE